MINCYKLEQHLHSSFNVNQTMSMLEQHLHYSFNVNQTMSIHFISNGSFNSFQSILQFKIFIYSQVVECKSTMSSLLFHTVYTWSYIKFTIQKLQT